MSNLLLADSLFRRVAAVPPLYLLLWSGLVALSALLVVLMWSRWGRSQTLQKCAVLSLLVHVLLACLAMTVRIVVGNGSAGNGAPIRVRLVDDPAAAVPQVAMLAPSPTTVEAPALFEPEPEPPKEAESKLEEAKPKEDKAEEKMGPPPLADPEPVAPQAEKDPFEMVDAEAEPPPVTKEVADKVATKEDKVEPESTETAVADPSVAPAPETEAAVAAVARPAAASPYAHRTSTDRLAILQLEGGSPETEAAVVAALDWLAASQSADGRWDASRFGAGQEQMVLGHDRHGAGGNSDTGISALALLAFLGAGHTHMQGDYQQTVRAGLEFLLRSQAADGNLFGPSELFARMYCHAMATFALGEAQAMTGDKSLDPALRRAVAYSMRAQHPSTGGWRYRVGDTGDTSQLGWQMMSLWSAKQAGVSVSPQTWTGIDRFLRSVRRGSRGGLASYRPDGPQSTSMTAEAMYCRLLLNEAIGGGLDDAALAEATGALLASPPTTQRINLYYWYYATLALHHRQQIDPRAREAWNDWNSDLTEVLLETQVGSGPEAGSWSQNTVWGGYGGRVYTTAMAALCLEVYYRYAPTSRDEWIATRPEREDEEQWIGNE